jgi:ABC-type oligopeptide transport system substrate-binding subunit
LRDVRVRRALALGVDRVALADKVRALGEPATESLVPVAVGDYPRHAVPEHASWPMAQRRAVAAQLLGAAGYTAARPLALTAIFSSNSLTQRSFLAMAAMWRPLGIELSAQGLESRAYNLALRAGEFDLMDYAPFSAVQSASSFIGRFHSRSFLNFSHYANPDVDRLIDLAERQLTAGLRAQQYLAVEQQLLRDWPVIPLYSGVTHRLVAARVRGWTANPGLSLPSRFLSVREYS